MTTLPPAPDSLFLDFQRAVAGQYSIERELGRGGMGVVYLAREVRLDRRVAIKVLPPALAARGELRERFLREARTAAKLSHPNIVQIFRVDEAGEYVYFAMALVDGETLGERLRGRGPLTPSEATRVLREIAWALAYAHRGGVVHRDVKPDNILLEQGTLRALVSDFGIARVTTLEQSPASVEGPSFTGTPHFMSPEQALGEQVDGRSDLYSLGVVAYLALSGKLPFDAATAQQAVAMTVTRDAPPLTSAAPGTPARLAIAVDRCLARDPAARWPSAEAFAEALEQSAERPKDIPAPIRVWLAKAEQHRAPKIMAGIYGGLLAGVTAVAAPSPIPGLIAGGVLATVMALVPLRGIRRVLKAGYTLDDMRLGLRHHIERRREELTYEYGADLVPMSRGMRLAAVTGIGVGTAMLLLPRLVGATLGAVEPVLPFAAIGAAAGGIVALLGVGRAIRRRYVARFGAWRMKFWNSTLAERVVTTAGFALQRGVVAGESLHRPTEFVIGRASEGLLKQLPKPVRDRLGNVGEVVARLEAQAAVVRAHIQKLDLSLAELSAHRPGSESRSLAAADVGDVETPAAAVRRNHEETLARVRSAKQQAESRLAQIVASLESIRLHLLRLHAGAGSVQELTIDLDAAAALDADLARTVAAQDEVAGALGAPPRRPSIDIASPSPA